VNSDRILLIAPHPDDEVIAAGGLIQRAGDVRVVFVTAGENNPWPQRAMLRKWRITGADRAEWAAMRKREALASLAVLGAPAECAVFLDFPDGGIVELARLRETLRAQIDDFRPSLVVAPSARDFHADHRAVSRVAHQAASGEIVTYVVHGDGAPQRLKLTLSLTEQEIARKRRAIECHVSQLLLGRRRFLSYAQGSEEFFAAEHDLAHEESRLYKFRHACFALFGARSARKQPAADVEDRAGDVPGVLRG
jgi:LmbE family N-acetylglucosaminyl deacetylase